MSFEAAIVTREFKHKRHWLIADAEADFDLALWVLWCCGVAAIRVALVYIFKITLQVQRRSHTRVQDAHYCDAVSCDVKVNYVSLNPSATVAGANLVTRRAHSGRMRQSSKHCRQGIDILVGLFHTPLLVGISPNRFKILLGGWGKPIFSHVWPTFVV